MTGCMALVLGIILRSSFAFGMPSINVPNFRHAHSHIMLLGWAFNGLIALWGQSIRWNNFQKALLITSHLTVYGMAISFPLFGYTLPSIALSSLHLIIGGFLLIPVLKKQRDGGSTMIMLAGFFYALSSLGPLLLGPLSALGLMNPVVHHQLISGYTHFFVYGVLLPLTIAYFYPEAKSKWAAIQLFLGVILSWFLVIQSDYSISKWPAIIGYIMLLGGFLSLQPNRQSNQFNMQLLTGSIYLFFVGQIVVSVYFDLSDLLKFNHNAHIAFIHFLFLGVFTPAIFIGLCKQPISRFAMVGYFLSFLFAEYITVYPGMLLETFNLSYFSALLYAYLIVMLFWIYFIVATILQIKKSPLLEK